MSIEALADVAASALAPLADSAMTMPQTAIPEPDTGEGSFDSLVSGIEALNDRLVAGGEAVHALALGQVDNLHQVMMAGEQTRLAFDLMLQVRGKVLDAYQELLRMQV